MAANKTPSNQTVIITNYPDPTRGDVEAFLRDRSLEFDSLAVASGKVFINFSTPEAASAAAAQLNGTQV
jgi:hypothetical protein